MNNYMDSLSRSLELGFPLIALTTPDYPDTASKVLAEVGKTRAIVRWDMARGALGLNDAGVIASGAMNSDSEPAVTTSKFEECLQRALDLMPEGTVLLLEDVHLLLGTKQDVERALYIQCIRNCRDPFKATSRALVFLVPSIQLPSELSNDVEIIDVPLPTEEDLNDRTEEICKAAELPAPDGETKQKVADALLGISMFAAENAMVKSLKSKGFDYPSLWETKKAYIRQVGCLSIPSSVATFDQLGGLDSIKEYGREIIGGKNRPRLVVLLDEIDKWIVSLSDSNGINGDAFGQFLGAMQDNNWDGITLPGFAGTGKTEWAKALGNEAGGMFLQLDLGGAKGGLVGDSERMIRQALAMLKAMGGDRVMFVATCNDMAILQTKPELLRRFAYGIHFFDLPSEEETRPIWDMYLRKFGIENHTVPSLDGWTGAEIKKACKLADEFGKPLEEVVGRITPVCKTMGAGVSKLRKQAEDGGWLSAKSGLPYTTKITSSNVRKILNTKG